MTSNEHIPLRELKRRKTLAAIELHATKLVEERGFKNVTVDDICAAAQISKRTFFNYVDSKETAVLGSPLAMPGEEVREKFKNTKHDNLVLALIDFIVIDVIAMEKKSLSSADVADLVERRKRIRLADRTIGLDTHYVQYEVFEALVALTVDYLTVHPECRKLSEDKIFQEALATVLMATSAVRQGFRLWLSPDNDCELLDMCRESLEMLRSILS
ncbi:TetR family transcriptional regulator [Corynebacterium felinum]|uniref:AcrR family transcriptional regulator n=1 Tax=Corynebacterium felinum TaxID=131318 RepID=A0ABU2B990_9CORY|nr:TetR family transcriptional regulator [Corynebacterium felinum]MDF5822015.1 TetR family transcriptional regulator [Corynebacterium felinum]MDR7355186.1 AcrR family transcriptional regulator [Corynebacterium felinum]WJY94537.1 Transcriptional regulator, TetR family [Corynebacterium felinum]